MEANGGSCYGGERSVDLGGDGAGGYRLLDRGAFVFVVP